METTTTTQQKEYTAPTLTIHGDVEKVTQGFVLPTDSKGGGHDSCPIS